MKQLRKFQALLADEVLPTLRKTGTYTIKDNQSSTKEEAQLARVKAMELNAKTRAAQTWLKIADRTKIQEYKEIANSYAANTLAGERVLELPTAEQKTYSATEIGNMFGVSANRIGKLANANNLKIPEYGKLFYDQAAHCDKQVEPWRYYENAIPVFTKLLGKGVA